MLFATTGKQNNNSSSRFKLKICNNLLIKIYCKNIVKMM